MNELEIFRQTLLVSRITLTVSVVVSIATITFGILNMAFQRSHNIKSVKPLCNIHTQISDQIISVSILNAGLGPMVIKKTGFIKPGMKPRKYGVKLHKILPSDIPYDILVTESEDYIVPAMTEKKLLEYTSNNKTGNNDIKALQQILGEHNIFITYEDIYNRRYTKIG